MPIKSFFTKTSPSLGSGTGRSVLYWRTSIPPVFSITTPFIVLGIELEAIVRAVKGEFNGNFIIRWELTWESRDVATICLVVVDDKLYRYRWGRWDVNLRDMRRLKPFRIMTYFE